MVGWRPGPPGVRGRRWLPKGSPRHCMNIEPIRLLQPGITHLARNRNKFLMFSDDKISATNTESLSRRAERKTHANFRKGNEMRCRDDYGFFLLNTRGRSNTFVGVNGYLCSEINSYAQEIKKNPHLSTTRLISGTHRGSSPPVSSSFMRSRTPRMGTSDLPVA